MHHAKFERLRRCFLYHGALQYTSSHKLYKITNNFRKAEYEDLIRCADGSLEGSHACWKAILSCIIPRNSGISTGFIENAGILTLNYTLTPSRVQPQWDVLASNIYTLLKMAVAAGSNDGKIHVSSPAEHSFCFSKYAETTTFTT